MMRKIMRQTGLRRNRRAFTLVELLVATGVIALLTAMVVPSLRLAKQTARRIVCGANLRSIGFGLAAYQHDNRLLPPQYDRWGPAAETYDNRHMEPWVSYVVYHQDELKPVGTMKPLQLAYLWAAGTLDTPAVFYCAGQPPRGDHAPFTYDYYTDDGRVAWGSVLPAKADGTPDDKIRSSYHYWLGGESSLTALANKPVVLDNIQHWNSVAHTRNGQPHGVNALFGDGHVSFSNHDELFELPLWNGGPEAGPWDGPGNDHDLFTAILQQLRP